MGPWTLTAMHIYNLQQHLESANFRQGSCNPNPNVIWPGHHQNLISSCQLLLKACNVSKSEGTRKMLNTHITLESPKLQLAKFGTFFCDTGQQYPWKRNNQRVTYVDYISQITSNNQLMKTFYAHMPITCTVNLKHTTTTNKHTYKQ